MNRSYQPHYDRLIESGLYRHLTQKKLLVAHEETCHDPFQPRQAYRILKPQRVPFISYPYEWCFSQLKDAARLTLEIQSIALRYEMILKDASAYNVQFLDGRPIFIDTLSFETYQEGLPWKAYRQFCRHFLAPLALMSLRDVRLSRLQAAFMDGIPLDLCSRLLPLGSRLRYTLLVHIHLHAYSEKRWSESPPSKLAAGVSRRGFAGIISSLQSAVERLKPGPGSNAWSDYYQHTNYSETAFQEKQHVVKEMLTSIRPASLWDLGANRGIFSRLAGGLGIHCLAFDFDHATVEALYRDCRRRNASDILPLWMDFTNPSASLGWRSRERNSLFERGPADAVLALAFMHHLVIGNHVSFPELAEFFQQIGRFLIIEFVPKSDSQVERMLRSREDIFQSYTRENFETAFESRFQIKKTVALVNSQRILYLMENRNGGVC